MLLVRVVVCEFCIFLVVLKVVNWFLFGVLVVVVWLYVVRVFSIIVLVIRLSGFLKFMGFLNI